jgi:hypothetical protein
MDRSINARLRRLEARWQPKPQSHHLTVVRYPWNLFHGDRDRWIREELPCACGVIGCPSLSIGLLSPAKAPSADEWSRAAIAYDAQRKALHA